MNDGKSNQEIFERMARKEYWSTEEAALLISIPEHSLANALEKLEQQINGYPFYAINPHTFGANFVEIYDTITRAVHKNTLSHLPHPKMFLAWAQRKKYSIPSELLAAVEEVHGQEHDWKELHQKEQEENQELKECIAVLQKEMNTQSVSGIQKISYLKIILGLAKHLGYMPDGRRNTLTGQNKGSIYAILNDHNLSVSDDTIRNILAEAVELCPKS